MNFVRLIGTRNLRWKMLPFARWAFVIFGRSWNDFYRWMLNLQERNTTLDMIFTRPGGTKEGERRRGLYAWGRGEYYLEFMRNHGLKPEHRVLDFGCGYGRAAIPLLKFLNAGNYIGSELCDKRIELAEEWVTREGLDNKEPQFVISTDNSMPYLQDKSIDVFWTYSVFTHVPEKEVHQILEALKRILRPKGVIYFNYCAPMEGSPPPPPTLEDFYWEHDKLADVVRSHGYKCELADDWDDSLDAKRNEEPAMLMLTLD